MRGKSVSARARKPRQPRFHFVPADYIPIEESRRGFAEGLESTPAQEKEVAVPYWVRD